MYKLSNLVKKFTKVRINKVVLLKHEVHMHHNTNNHYFPVQICILNFTFNNWGYLGRKILTRSIATNNGRGN